MSAFLAAALSFPTVIFTVMLVFFALYAVATLLGAADIESLDGVLGIDDTNDSFLEGGLHALGVEGIPLTIFGGAATLFAWITSFLSVRFLPDTITLDVLILLGSAFVGIATASAAVRPLRPIFHTPEAPKRQEIVGKICTIRSLRVNDGAGTAEVEDGGAGIIAEVRCFRENELTLGSKAIVYDYDSEQGVYHVGPLDPAIYSDQLNTELSALSSQLSGKAHDAGSSRSLTAES